MNTQAHAEQNCSSFPYLELDTWQEITLFTHFQNFLVSCKVPLHEKNTRETCYYIKYMYISKYSIWMKTASIGAVDAFVIMQTLMRHLKCHVHYSEEAAVQTTVSNNWLHVFGFIHKHWCFINTFRRGKNASQNVWCLFRKLRILINSFCVTQ